MTTVKIVCSSCGRCAARVPVFGGRPLLFALEPERPTYSADRGPGDACPLCGAAWAKFRAGDEYLVGLANVVSLTATPSSSPA